MVAAQRQVRRALLQRLKADTGLSTLLPAASINPVETPTWPFIVLRSPVTRQLKAACLRGAEGSWDIHAFAGPRTYNSGAMIETAEDHASIIGGAIEACLADNWLDLEEGGRVRIRLSDIRLLQDGDPDHYHWFAQVNWRVLSD